MKKLLKLLYFALFILLLSCSSNDDVDKAQIRSVIWQIQDDFNNFDIERLMRSYHHAYMHSGKSYHNVYSQWEEWNNDYIRLRIDIIGDIELDDVYATVNAMLYFNEDDLDVTPIVGDDLSEFYREDGKWILYGNQLYE